VNHALRTRRGVVFCPAALVQGPGFVFNLNQMKAFFNSFRIVDADSDFIGSVFIQDRVITHVVNYNDADYVEKCGAFLSEAGFVFNGHGRLVLTSGFIDLHAHFRDPGFPEKEVLESGCLAAARGGWTTVVCMANTRPVIDNLELWGNIRGRACELELVDLYPVVSLTRGMEGKELSGFTEIDPQKINRPLLLSEDGKDVYDDGLFLRALEQAGRLGIPVSCHCDKALDCLGETETLAVLRSIQTGLAANCRVHITHVSKADTVLMLRVARDMAGRAKRKDGGRAFVPTAEAAPHHIALTCDDAERAGRGTFGNVAPPLGTEEDRLAVIGALRDGTIDVIATDHAPHTADDKEDGAPGFTGLETAFPVVHTVLCGQHNFPLRQVSALMSARPAGILGLKDRGYVRRMYNADLTVLDIEKKYRLTTENFCSRSKNSLFPGRELTGKVVFTMCNGKITYSAG